MLMTLLTIVYIFLCLMIIALVLVQKGKGGSGLFGSMASTQMKIFGAGGQDIFQRMTWVAGGLLMTIAFVMSLLTLQSSGFYVDGADEVSAPITYESVTNSADNA